jgi:hypothetical protein
MHGSGNRRREGGSGPPFNTELPKIKHNRNAETGKQELGESGFVGEFEVGETVVASEGKWTGTNSPMTFSFQWKRCTPSGACEDIGTPGSEKYEITQEDVRHTLEVVLTATNSPEPGVTAETSATSEQTAIVKEKGEGRSEKGNSIGSPKAGGETYTTIETGSGATVPLEEAGYEFKLAWSKINEEEVDEEMKKERSEELLEGGKTLVTVATPRAGS